MRCNPATSCRPPAHAARKASMPCGQMAEKTSMPCGQMAQKTSSHVVKWFKRRACRVTRSHGSKDEHIGPRLHQINVGVAAFDVSGACDDVPLAWPEQHLPLLRQEGTAAHYLLAHYLLLTIH